MSFPQIVGISAIYAKARPSSTEWQPDGLGRTPVWISWLILVHEYCILIAFNNSRSELLLSLPWMYRDMKNYFSVQHSGARSKGRTRDFNIPNTVDFLTFLVADLTNGLSQQLLATFDSLLPPILGAGKLLCSCGCQLCCWISRNMFIFPIEGADETGSRPSPTFSYREH